MNQHSIPICKELDHTWVGCEEVARHAFAMPPTHFRMLLNAYDSQKRVHKVIRTRREDRDMIDVKSLLKVIDWHEDTSYERLPNMPSLRSFLRGLSPKRRKKRIFNQALRIDIAYRQGYACNQCGLFPIPPTFQLDHVIRLADGGADAVENLQALCVECHARKTRAETTGRPPIACNQIFSKYFLRK
jgi:5-methylcytosine-specific restriction endonuclease McrA